MAIQIYSGKPKTFKWDGMEIGLRLPNVEEMTAISAARDEFFASMSPETPAGDQGKLVAFNYLVGKTLACDPDNRKNPWFAEDREKQRELADNSVNKDVAEDMPSSFFVAATAVFNEMINRANLTDENRATFDKNLDAARKEAAGDSEAGNSTLAATESETIGTPSIPTPPNSDDSPSESPSISNANSIPSIDGATISS